MYSKKQRSKIIYFTFVPLVAGGIFGCILYFLCILILDMPVSEYGLEDYGVASTMNVSAISYAFYVCKRRILQWCAFFAIWNLGSYYVAAGSFTLLFGGYFGFLLADLFVKFGIKGLGYLIGSCVPHYIIMFATVYWMGKWFCINDNSTQMFYGNVNKMQYFVKIFAIILLILLSVFLEIKFQKNILNYFYQYLV